MTMIFVNHTRDAGLCASGCRKWFLIQGLNWSDFLEHGISAERLRATGSALCEQVIEVAERG
jgi:hypothetical protein